MFQTNHYVKTQPVKCHLEESVKLLSAISDESRNGKNKGFSATVF